MTNLFARPTGRYLSTLLLVGSLGVAGCDSGGTDDEITIRGRVSDDASSGLTTGPIEGAAVVAAEVSSSGELSAMSGQATTDADGEFSLETEGTTAPVLSASVSVRRAGRSRLAIYGRGLRQAEHIPTGWTPMQRGH